MKNKTGADLHINPNTSKWSLKKCWNIIIRFQVHKMLILASFHLCNVTSEITSISSFNWICWRWRCGKNEGRGGKKKLEQKAIFFEPILWKRLFYEYIKCGIQWQGSHVQFIKSVSEINILSRTLRKAIQMIIFQSLLTKFEVNCILTGR